MIPGVAATHSQRGSPAWVKTGTDRPSGPPALSVLLLECVVWRGPEGRSVNGRSLSPEMGDTHSGASTRDPSRHGITTPLSDSNSGT